MTKLEIDDLMARSDLESRPDCLVFYEALVANGNPPSFAVMLALQQPPRVLTDGMYTAGHGTLQKQFEGQEVVLERVVKVAKSHGYKPNANDFYDRNLARFQGDPEAFVTPGEGIDYVKRKCLERGSSCYDNNGTQLVKRREPEQDPHAKREKRLAKDIVARKLKQALKHRKNRELGLTELKQRIIQKHGSN